jgi:hypothetical protein
LGRVKNILDWAKKIDWDKANGLKLVFYFYFLLAKIVKFILANWGRASSVSVSILSLSHPSYLSLFKIGELFIAIPNSMD